MSYAPTPLAERFWAKVEPEPNSGCFIWAASRNEHGYGQIGIRGASKPWRAHRVSWELHNGPIPAGMNVLHRCDNPWCVAPAHLFLGTLRDNSQDAASKGRYPHQWRQNCRAGHPLYGVNLYINPSSGARTCRQCVRDARRSSDA